MPSQPKHTSAYVALQLLPTRSGFWLSSILLLLLAILVQRAWLSDDAFITFRSVDNFLNGYGLVWNIGERVQSYTHPLWMLLLSLVNWLTGELVFSSLVLSIVISLAVFGLVGWRLAVSPASAAFALLGLGLSNAFIDYSTSGLENPLSHLLLAGFFALFFTLKPGPRNAFWLSFVASLGMLNRLDTFLLFAPALLYYLLQTRQPKAWLAALAGQLPLVAWELFSLLYYGFPFPNTAYAKLNTGINQIELATQGLRYLIDSIQVDPITLALLGAGLFLALIARDRRSLMIAIGAGLYLAYVIQIGGDFMSGRFLAAPYLCSLLIIARLDLSQLPKYGLGLLFSMVLLLGLLSPTPTFNFREVDLSARERSAMVNDQKISNERRYYAWSTGLLRIDRQSGRPAHPYAEDGVAARQAGPAVTRRITVGMFGYYAGPQVHVVDELALGDALLARLPARRVDQWRIGHFQRTLPAGYLESIRSRINQLADSNLAKYYDALLLVIQGKLIDPLRLAAIWKLNSGQYDGLIDFDSYRYPKLVLVQLSQIDQAKGHGSAWDAGDNFIFGESGIEIVLNQRSWAKQIELSLDGDNAYQVVYLDENQEIARQRLPAQSSRSGLQTTCLETPAQASQAGFTRLRVFATQGDDRYSLGSFRLDACTEP